MRARRLGTGGIRLRYRYRGIQTRRGEHAGRELTGTGVGCKWRSTRVALQRRTRLPSESWRMKTTMPSWAFPVVACHRATCEHTLLARMQTHLCRRTHRGARGPVESNHAEPHTSGDPLVLMKHLWPRRGRRPCQVTHSNGHRRGYEDARVERAQRRTLPG